MNQVILMGGLDNRPNDKNIDEQAELVRKGLKRNLPIKGFRYLDRDGVLNEIEKNNKSYIILFSAGCQNAEQIAQKVKEVGGKLSNIYIVEPYHQEGSATKSVRNAISIGVPQSNVIVGKTSSTGLGIVEGATPTPSCSPSHWCALTEVAKFLA